MVQFQPKHDTETAWDSDWPANENVKLMELADAAEHLPWCDQILLDQLPIYQLAARASGRYCRVIAQEGGSFINHVYGERKQVQTGHIAVEIGKHHDTLAESRRNASCNLSQFWHYVRHPDEAQRVIDEERWNTLS